jgi:hypothetical protein
MLSTALHFASESTIPIVLAALLVGICVHFYVERPIGRILNSRFSTSVADRPPPVAMRV